jgi:transketolase
VAIASALPNMTVIAPCDPAETRLVTRWCTTQQGGPVYLRLGKAGEPDLTAGAEEPWRFGRLRYLTRGRDVCILSYGSTVKLAGDVAEHFREQGRSVSLVSVHTLKPLDREGITQVLRTHDRVVVIEELAPFGGLGPQVKAIAWDAAARCRLDTFALEDAFHHVYGSHGELLTAHGLSRDAIVSKLGAM